jgi:hypothetical protein
MLTTLELAAALVRTVRRHPELSDVQCAAEVFEVLHISSAWFCRCSEVDGISVETPFEQEAPARAVAGPAPLAAIVARIVALEARLEELRALKSAAEPLPSLAKRLKEMGVPEQERGVVTRQLLDRAAATGTARRPPRRATPSAGETVDLTPGCDCDQAGTPDAAVHASDCTWIARRLEVQNGG